MDKIMPLKASFALSLRRKQAAEKLGYQHHNQLTHHRRMKGYLLTRVRYFLLMCHTRRWKKIVPAPFIGIPHLKGVGYLLINTTPRLILTSLIFIIAYFHLPKFTRS
jgi:hypothetical protein